MQGKAPVKGEPSPYRYADTMTKQATSAGRERVPDEWTNHGAGIQLDRLPQLDIMFRIRLTH